MNRRSSLRSSSDRRPGVGPSAVVGVEPLDGVLEAIAADEPHGVKRPAVGVGAQAVDRDDARMLEPAGDLGLEQESAAALRVIGVRVEDLLERDLAMQLAVESHEDGAEPAAGVRPQDAKSLAVAGRGADGVAGVRSGSTSSSGSVGPSRRGRASRRARRRRVCVRRSRVERPTAIAARLLLGVAAVLLQVKR